jgi:hypothetical protein
MRTHELSRYLIRLARLLRQGPNLDLDFATWESLRFGEPARRMREKAAPLGRNDLPVALSALLALSSIDKRDWAELISEMGLKIQIRPRDASRDLLGKVLRVLEHDPIARRNLTDNAKSRRSRASPELVRALSTLLK